MTGAEAALEHRVLVRAPVGRDAALIAGTLQRESIACQACSSLEHLLQEVSLGAGALLIAEEALIDDDRRLELFLAQQPPWSDLPILLLSHPGADSVTAAGAVRTLGNVALLERPLRIGSLVSAVRSALRARRRQYVARAYLQERVEADRRKDQFLATLAHELRNPLAPIVNALTLLRLKRSPGTSDPTVDIIDRQVRLMVRLIDDLLDVSRITSGKVELRKRVVDLADVVSAAIETSRPLIDAAEHRLSVNVPASTYFVNVDRQRIAQVFSNLLNNAARYSDPHGHIRIDARTERSNVVVEVRDSGMGIPKQALQHIFEMFAQVNQGDRRSQAGLGVGLTVARTLVEMHGGAIAVASEGQDRGSSFSVSLVLANSVEVPDVPAAPAVGGRPRRVLVLDDNADAADTLGQMLRALGHEVLVTYESLKAMEAITEFRPEMVLMDIGMADMDGYEVARRIRARRDLDGVVLVAVTGWGQASDRRRTAEAGFDHHLVKPVSAAALSATLATLDSRTTSGSLVAPSRNSPPTS